MTEFVKNPDWPDGVKLTDVGKYPNKRTITITFCENITRMGGYYVVLRGDESIFEGSFYRAKQKAMETQGDNGRPIERQVVKV